jgi:tripartite-type tricarboxylate transporter receptor subunit TctC
MTVMQLRRLRMLVSIPVFLLLCTPASSQSFPSRPIQVVSSASPGSSGDAALRMMAAKMTESMGQPVIVELRTAARGGQAYAVVGKAAPDGHTLTFGTSGTFVYGRFLFKNMTFDVLKDYAPVSLSLNSPSYVAVHESRGINSMKELVDYARKNPGKLEFGTTGNGSYFHLAGEALRAAANIDLLHVPYAQANFPQMINDWSSGRVAMYFPTWATLKPSIARMKVLAIIDQQPSKYLPEVRPVAELLPDYRPFVVWWGFFGPVGVPGALAGRIGAESRKAMLQPDVASKIEDLGMNVIGSGPEELAKVLRQDIDAVGKVVKAIGLQPE